MAFARVFSLFTIALSLLAVVVAGPIPVAEDADVADLEKRITHSGVATYFYQKGNAGACGHVNPDSALIVATPQYFWNTNGSGNCGQYVQITGNGKTKYAKVADECPECDQGHLDMSTGLFKEFTNLSVGEFKITWHFMAKGWKP